jgi:hypothetical protein
MVNNAVSVRIIESLRRGIPPQQGVNRYSVGNEKLIEGITRYHLSGIKDRGIFRFINGSWGAGKTHLFRQLRENAFQSECLVSSVELDTTSTALNKFEQVFYSIVRQIAIPSYNEAKPNGNVTPFAVVIRESLSFLGSGDRDLNRDISYEQYKNASDTLMANYQIDIDFKKMVQEYWKTFLPDAGEAGMVAQSRGEILQWFGGEGTVGIFRKRFGISKMVNRQNAKLMLQSLAGFVHLAGYAGLLILFDEAEQAYSVMRKSALRDAHNNLLSLINNIEALPGLFLIYATTPDFFNDPKHGIVIYGALASRIGKPEQRLPRALDTIWNLDAAEPNLPAYQAAAQKIRKIYEEAYPEVIPLMPNEKDLMKMVADLQSLHPPAAAIRFWRVLVTAMISSFDDLLEGQSRPTENLYYDVMANLKES